MYTTLNLSPRKKRCPPESDDDLLMSPKKLRLTAPSTRALPARKPQRSELPKNLERLCTIHAELQNALSHALATCALSPTADTGIVRNVLNHVSLSSYAGITTSFEVDDLRRLCWVLEWDGKTRPSDAADDDNPFLDDKPTPKDWTRGGMGLVISAASHHLRNEGKRVPAYGLGIEVEMDIDKDMTPGIAAVARWTGSTASRCKDFREKLDAWVKLSDDTIAPIPYANLPKLTVQTKVTSLTKTLASLSPKSSLPVFKLPPTPASPSRSPQKTKVVSQSSTPIPFPLLGRSPTKNSIAFPQTPSSRAKHSLAESTPRTPRTSTTATSESTSVPSTPVHQRGVGATIVPATPTSSRREALYERLRQRSLSTSPTKTAAEAVGGGTMTRDQMLKLGQEGLRKRCLLGRLGGVADSIWMLFSTPSSGAIGTATPRKRRALPMSEVTAAVIKSSPVPISSAEAVDSVSMLTTLCPFFLKPFSVAGEAWLEMPASSTVGNTEASPSKKTAPPSPGRALDTVEALVTRSPRKVKVEAGGLREVREIIRRELELHD
ncbi:CDT1-C domain-containing protein [Mycena kentingensis (nom. inval.)]|nr:CDT1-C domain-containing protein [Mycena kentingensis (nom. inval.)]